MASGPITSWQIDGETVEIVSDFTFLGSQITADGDCSHEIKSRLLLGRKVMTNLDSIFKSRDITLPTKVRLVKAMVFPVVMYGCESRRIDALELWCWNRLLRVPWTARRSNQSMLKEISPGCSLEGLMLKLKLQYFGHLVWRADSLEKTLMLGGIEDRRRRGWQGWDGWMASPTWWRWVWVNSRSWWWTGRPGVLRFMGSQRVGHNWATELKWTELMSFKGFPGHTSGKEPACQFRRYKRHGLDPWLRKIPQRRAWQPIPVFLPGKPHGQRILEGYSPWGYTESDMTEAT